jgi:hypothetical protein
VLNLKASSISSSEAERELPQAPRRLRGGRPVLALSGSFLLTVALLLGWAWNNREWLQSDIKQHGVTETYVLAALDRWRTGPRSPRLPGAVLFGDSLTDCKERVLVGELVARRLAAAGMPHALVQLTGGAFSPLQYYYLLDEVLADAPRLAIVEVNLGRLSGGVTGSSLRYASLSRKLSLARAWRVRTALAFDGLTLFDPAIYRLEEKLDAMYAVPGAQAAWRAVLDSRGAALGQMLHLDTVPPDARSLRMLVDFDVTSARNLFGPQQSVHPFTAVLKEFAAELRSAGVPMLFYLSPVNPDVLREARSSDKAEFPRRIDALRVAIGLTPGEWVDLHGLLRREVFRDWSGHMLPAGCEAVADAIRDALVSRSAPIETRADGRP